MDHVRIAAPHAFRRFALQVALGLALAESALFFFVWRLGVLVEPAAGRQPALAFVLLGSVLTLQAMVVVGIAWAVVAISRTTVDADETGLTLEHPWRRWHGDWWTVPHGPPVAMPAAPRMLQREPDLLRVHRRARDGDHRPGDADDDHGLQREH